LSGNAIFVIVMPQPMGRPGVVDSCALTQATRPTADARQPSPKTRSKASRGTAITFNA